MVLFPPQLYFTIFIWVTFAFVMIQYGNISAMSNSSLLAKNNNNSFFLLFAFLFVVVVGLRPVHNVFGDTVNYAYEYWNMADGLMEPSETDDEWIFSYTMYWFANWGLNVMWFFLLVETLYIIPMYLVCKRLSEKNTTLLLLFCFSAFSFFTYGVNGIRNGMACSLILLALSYLNGNTKDKVVCASLCFIAFNIHRSTALPIIAMIYSWKYANPRNMFYFWGASIFLSLTIGGVIESFFAGLGFDDRMTDYLGAQNDEEEMSQFSQTGFRWDFLLYSSMPIWLGWYMIFKRNIYDKTYLLLLGTYIYSNAFWVMVIRSSFSNRFAYLSWFLYPVVMAYPLVKFNIWSRQGRKTGLILITHFAFTLVMWLIGK